LHEETLRSRIIETAHAQYQGKLELVGADVMHQYESAVMLQSLDTHWREHLAALDHLRQGIHLRGYAAKNPKQEYKREAFELFADMLELIKAEVSKIVMTVQIKSQQDVEAVEPPPTPENVQYHHADYDEALAQTDNETKTRPFVRGAQKIGRNDPCPCGSGKKYKHCHGKLA
jgi:preprotein translocase subunit SecA